MRAMKVKRILVLIGFFVLLFVAFDIFEICVTREANALLGSRDTLTCPPETGQFAE